MDTKTITGLNFGETLGFYLHEQGLIDDPRDVGQAEIERFPASVDDAGSVSPAVHRIAYITRSGTPEWRYAEIEPSPEAFMWELMRTVLRHPGYLASDGY